MEEASSDGKGPLPSGSLSRRTEVDGQEVQPPELLEEFQGNQFELALIGAGDQPALSDPGGDFADVVVAEVAGRADVLVCPSIDAANILYKSIAALVKYGLGSIAGVTVGFPVPYIILSRADHLSTRLESVALGSIYAQRSLVADAAEPRRSPERKGK